MKPLVLTRKTWVSDLPALKMLFAEDAMPLPSKEDLLRGIAAVNESGELVGFIRILQINDDKNPEANGNYVYPVIVFKSWQGHGVGRVLIEAAHKHYGALKLVACKASRDFYPKCGFEPLEWKEVAEVIAYDCECCPDQPTCFPQPYILPGEQ